MDKNSTPNFLQTLDILRSQEALSNRILQEIQRFYLSYQQTLSSCDQEQVDALFFRYLNLIQQQCEHPYVFPHFHKKIHAPFDYYQFCKDFFRPLVVYEQSTIRGNDHLHAIEKKLEAGHNVIFFANHQTESDPPLIALLLEKEFPKLSERMLFVAGERVITDLLAIPFSLGCDLLCIYSKRYIDHPPEQKLQKQLHNKKTMSIMSELLRKGGQCIYVAPSGGRDRRGPDGEIEVASFDPKSIEMFYLMVKKSKTPTSFYPMALKTYDLLPPPEKVEVAIGEQRSANRTPIHMAIGDEIHMDQYPNSDHPNKMLRRKSRSDYIWALVKKDYSLF